MTRIKEVKNVIEYYDAEVALRICKHSGYYYLMCLQGTEGEKTKLYSCYSLVKLKDTIERYARIKMTTIFENDSYLKDLKVWTVEWRIARIWDSVLSEIMSLQEIEDFELAMRELEKIKEIPGDPCTGPVYFGVE